MKIVVFGSKKCKFCVNQIEIIRSAFSDNDWMYVDINKNKESYKIASESKVENIPTTIVFDNDWNPISKHEGTTSCDNLFMSMHGDKSIPVGPNTEKLIRNKEVTSCLLSNKRPVVINDFADIVDYRNKKITTAKIISVDKISPKAASSLCNPIIMKEYNDLGGRKDWAQLIVFGI